MLKCVDLPQSKNVVGLSVKRKLGVETKLCSVNGLIHQLLEAHKTTSRSAPLPLSNSFLSLLSSLIHRECFC